MSENQHTEWKESWRDEYMKHVCAFANAQGGSLFIGVKDNGTVIGVRDCEKLLEDIPNKIMSLLGIIVDLHLRKKTGMQYLEIKVPQSSVPISYHGAYYVRSGSTKQEIKGIALQQFILKKTGKTYDELPVDGSVLHDIDKQAILAFLKKARFHNRIPVEAAHEEPAHLLAKLHLLTADNKLKNAAILLFGKDPLRFFVSAG